MCIDLIRLTDAISVIVAAFFRAIRKPIHTNNCMQFEETEAKKKKKFNDMQFYSD